MDEIQADRWRRLRPLLDHAIALEGDARRAYLDGLSGGDAELKPELEQLLARHERLKHRTPSIAIGLVTLAFSQEEEAQSAVDDRDRRPRADAYRNDAGSLGEWFVADAGPKDAK